ncbi:MAG: SDR family NAD(P)-dependent oxidoreductase [Candidatus Dormibacteraeota bacterium]|jgi:3-oxoacyl-[acyl-carrier protein] reductase|nr:SDR family NAD(P)-dependent oxidoreductase [Candidatus Dormibacteraeota bacterium]
MAMFDLSGRVAMVTGASRGLGRADALALARAGCDVVVADLLVESDPNLESVAEASGIVMARVMATDKVVFTEQTAAEIREMGRRALAVQLDVTDFQVTREAVDRVVDEFGRIDILVNSAGAHDHVGQIMDQSPDLWERDLKVNLTGAYNCSQAVWPHMRARNFGRLIFMSSITGVGGGFGQASISTTSAGILGLMRSLALEGARHGITSNAVVAGIIATESFRTTPPEMVDRMVLRTAMRAPGTPEDVAAAVCYLASPEASYVTGIELPVAGGIDLFTF